MKILIPFAFLLIIGSLFSALFFVMKDKGKSSRAVYALTFRVGFSVLLFLILIISFKLGWIHPHDIGQ